MTDRAEVGSAAAPSPFTAATFPRISLCIRVISWSFQTRRLARTQMPCGGKDSRVADNHIVRDGRIARPAQMAIPPP